jgi:hypothetical protein
MVNAYTFAMETLSRKDGIDIKTTKSEDDAYNIKFLLSTIFR